MKDSNKTYSVFDLIENEEILTHVSAKEASEYLNVSIQTIFNYSQSGANLKRRYRITRNEEIINTRPEWIVNFETEWEFICNFLNPNRKVAQNNGNEQEKNPRI